MGVYIAKLIRCNGFTLGMFSGEVGLPNLEYGSLTGENGTAFVICLQRWVTECLNVLLRDPLQGGNIDIIAIVKEGLVQ